MTANSEELFERGIRLKNNVVDALLLSWIRNRSKEGEAPTLARRLKPV
jgi:hypothetical protein